MNKMMTPLQRTSPSVLHSFISYKLTRLLSTSNTYGNKKPGFEAQRMARMMQKIMSGTKHSARQTDYHSPSKHLKEFGFMKSGKSVSHRPVSGRLMRRTDMLNNLFVEQITSLLATGEVAPEFLGLGIQISKVRVTSDFSAVNVYWYASGTEKDTIIDQLLSKTSGHLRHMLTQLRVIGVVPPINFYKDTTFSKLQEVEMLLNKCSVETSAIESTDDANVSRVLGESPVSEVKSCETEKLEKILCGSEIVIEDKMSHDILGLRHDVIMNEVKKAIQRKSEKKKAREQNYQISTITDGIPENEQINTNLKAFEEEIADRRKRQYEFLKYLRKQQAERSKALKRDSVEAKEKEFYRDVLEERRINQLENKLDEMDEFEDSDVEDESDYNEVEEKYYENFRESFK